MAEVDDIISERLDRIETIPNRFSKRVGSIQDEIFVELLALLNELEITDGKLVLNAANLRRVEEIMLTYQRQLQGGRYGRIVGGFIKQLDEQKSLIDREFQLDFGAAITSGATLVHNQSIELAQRVLLGDDFKTNFINVIQDELTRQVEAKAEFTETRMALRNIVLGSDERQPRMLGYVNQVTSDLFSFSDRKYANTMADDLGLQFGQYSGGLIKDSREFCVKRAGQYYHIEEVRSWASEQWQGKFRNTSPSNMPFVLGGYNCQHVFVHRSLINIPKEVIERAMASGYFEPSERERELLGL